MTHIRDKKFTRFAWASNGLEEHDAGNWVQAQDAIDFQNWVVRDVDSLEKSCADLRNIVNQRDSQIRDLHTALNAWSSHADNVVKQNAVDESGIQILKDWIERLLIERQQSFQGAPSAINVEILDANSGFEG